MKRTFTIDRLFVLVFVTIIVLPLLQMMFGIVPVAAVNEKRVLFNIPGLWPRLERGDPTLAADFNRWFDDRYGFRDFLIRMKNQIDYSIFGTSQKVAIGKEGWLFLRDQSDVLVSYERKGDAWRGKVEAKMLVIARYLGARGIRFIVLAVPDKSDLYPMMKPKDMAHRPDVTQFDRMREDLSAHPELIYLDAKNILKESGDGQYHYWKTDIHYDYEAARRIVEALVKTISDQENRSDITPISNFTKRAYSEPGDISDFLPKLTPIRVETFQFENQYVVDQDTADGHWEKDPRKIDVPGWGKMPPFDFIYRSNREFTPAKLPATVLFGNSFSDLYFNVGIQTYFKEFYRARNVGPRFDLSLQMLPAGTKYVVYQYFAPFIGTDMDESNLENLPRPVARPRKTYSRAAIAHWPPRRVRGTGGPRPWRRPN